MLPECAELLDEAFIGELLESAIERGRPEMKLAAGLVENVAHDAEAVFGLGGESEQDVKGRRLHPAIVALYTIGRSPLPSSLFPTLPPSKAPERITHIRIATLEPAAEPLCALGGRPVRELVGANGAGHLRLESVVTNG
jgi:hypothetical protein